MNLTIKKNFIYLGLELEILFHVLQTIKSICSFLHSIILYPYWPSFELFFKGILTNLPKPHSKLGLF